MTFFIEWNYFFCIFVADMLRVFTFIRRTLSVRLSLTVVCAITSLLIVALLVMFLYSRRVIKDEVLLKAEETLECTSQQIDNILLSAEQATGNMMYNIFYHLDDPDEMYEFSRKLVEKNQFIKGCAIAMEPYYYKEKGEWFMAYNHRPHIEGVKISDQPIVQNDTFGNVAYNRQIWYTKPFQAKQPVWIGPIPDPYADGEAIITFSIPLTQDDGQKIGVVAVDIAIGQLTNVIHETKPSKHFYAMLLNHEGKFIINPTLIAKDTTSQYTPAIDVPEKLLHSMLAGETGYKQLKHNDHHDYAFYKPFVRKADPNRSTEEPNWAICIVYPEEDIFSDYNHLLTYTLIIGLISVVLLLVFCQLITQNLLSPLHLLTEATHRIANGHYEGTIPPSKHTDEVGRLQDNFKQMQQSLSVHISELEQLNTQQHERTKSLKKAYEKAKEADRMKIAFLHNMTNKMMEPVDIICSKVEKLCDDSNQRSAQKSDKLVKDIERQCIIVVELLNDLLRVSERLTSKR